MITFRNLPFCFINLNFMKFRHFLNYISIYLALTKLQCYSIIVITCQMKMNQLPGSWSYFWVLSSTTTHYFLISLLLLHVYQFIYIYTYYRIHSQFFSRYRYKDNRLLHFITKYYQQLISYRQIIWNAREVILFKFKFWIISFFFNKKKLIINCY